MKSKSPSMPKPKAAPLPPPISLTPEFMFFSRQQQEAAKSAKKYLDMSFPELQAQYGFQNQQRGFLSPVLSGQGLPGRYNDLGTPYFSSEMSGRVFNDMGKDLRDQLQSQGLADSGAEMEALENARLKMAADLEQARRNELFNVSQLATNWQPAVIPDITGALGAQSQIGSAFLEPIMADRQMIGQLSAGNANSANQMRSGMGGGGGGGFGSALGQLGTMSLLGGLSGKNPFANPFAPTPAALFPGGPFAGVGGSSAGFLGGIGAGLGALFSSRAVKENIEERHGFVDVVKNLKVYGYDYKPEYGEKNRLGLIAEEVPPELQTMKDGVRAIDAYGLIALLLGAVKELTQKVEALSGGKNG